MTTLQDLVDAVSDKIVKINPSRRYWFIRTNGGRYYEAFIGTGCVGIGYNDINPSALNGLEKLPKEKREFSIKKIFESTYPMDASSISVGNAVSQIQRFMFEITAGDVILIPDYSSHRLMIGEVCSSDIHTQSHTGKNGSVVFDLNKCRRVNWIQEVERDQLNNKLFGFFYSQKTIANLDDYESEIDSLYNDFYQKGPDYHCIFRVLNRERINAKAFLSTWNGLIETSCLINNNEPDEFDIKTDVRSPGAVEYIGYVVGSAVALWIVGSFLCGGKSKVNIFHMLSYEGQNPGLIQKISDFFKEHPEFKQKVLDLLSKKKSLNIDINKDFENIANPDFHAEYTRLPRRTKKRKDDSGK